MPVIPSHTLLCVSKKNCFIRKQLEHSLGQKKKRRTSLEQGEDLQDISPTTTLTNSSRDNNKKEKKMLLSSNFIISSPLCGRHFTSLIIVVLATLFLSAVNADSCDVGCAPGYYYANCTASCVKCSPGFYCLGNLTMPQPCAGGHYSTADGNDAASDCLTCGVGLYSNNGSTACLSCAIHSYSTGGAWSCTSCNADQVANAAKSSCVTCTLGTYPSATADVCLNCSAGYSCASRTVDMEAACPQGSYSVNGGGVCLNCEAGFACPATTTECTAAASLRNKYKCPAGTYSTGNTSVCTTCPPMYYCPATNSSNMYPCPVGFYSMGGAVNCTICPPGFRCPQDSTTGQPLICASGESSTSRTNCTVCPAGYACPTAASQVACTLGTYSPAGALSCSPCPSGHACPNASQAPVMCLQGTYSPGGTVTACILCNATATLAYYQNSTNATHCDVCPDGYKCPNIDASPDPCPLGYYSGVGQRFCQTCLSLIPQASYTPATASTSCQICPAGSYCPNAMVMPQPCVNGTYSGPGQFNCTLCPAGFSCVSPLLPPSPCFTGTYSLGGQRTCTLCPVNYRCISVDTAPVQCNLAIGEYSPLGDSLCYTCPQGTICSYNSSADNITFSTCASGTYRLQGSSECVLCPAGYFCPTPNYAPIRCPATYYSLLASTSCSVCPAGKSCSNMTDPVWCTFGWYSLEGDMDCHPCPIGHRCPNPWTHPIVCPLGTYSEGTTTNCTLCPRGWECPEVTQFTGVARPCQPGWYSVGGQISCTQCPSGSYCPSIFDANVIACTPGWYTTAGSTNCTVCKAGFACPTPVADVTPMVECVAGSYSLAGATVCQICPAGSECPYTNQQVVNICSNGTFSAPGQSACTVCAAGYYCPLTAVSAAQPMFGVIGIGRQVPCPAGSYAPAGSFQCFLCPKGFYCTSTTANDGGQSVCPSGYMTALGSTYADRGATNCAPCPSGYECTSSTSAPSPCAPGQYAQNGFCFACPAGFECPSTTTSPSPCPEGQYSTNNSVACKPCYAGYLCAIQSTTPTPSDRPCPIGSYCPSGSTVALLCPAGTYGQGTHGVSMEQACADCHAGYHCAAGTEGMSMMNQCPEGSYCPPGAPFPTPCPAGTYSDVRGATTRAVCLLCPEGYFCPAGTARYAVNGCPPGFFCPPGTGSGFENGCPVGTYSAEYRLSAATQCIQCPSGYSCPTVGMTAATPCQTGYYQPEPGSSACRPCEPGWACNRIGMTTSFATPCDAGHYCPRGTAQPDAFACPSGSYTFKTNLADINDCEACWKGHTCPAGTGKSPYPVPISCSMGHYCPGAPFPLNGKYYYLGLFSGLTTSTPTQYPCAPGSYTNSTDLFAPEQCTPCPRGKYCVGGQAAPTADCGTGYYCPLNSYDPHQVPCSAGTYNPSFGKSVQSDCLPCTPGNYCPVGSSTMYNCPPGSYTPFNGTTGAGPTTDVSARLCIQCPAGFYCAAGSTAPVECSAGSYSAAGASGCLSCEAGRYCPQKATTADQKERLFLCPAGLLCTAGMSTIPSAEYNACPTGSYCPLGTTAAVACLPGTYNPVTGRGSVTECLLCTKGYYCSITGANKVTGECDPGYYCPAGSSSSSQEPCPPRYYRSQTRGEDEDFCSVCPRGFYCPEGTSDPIPCTRGYYCIAGSEQPQPCPIGTFGNTTNLKSQDECSACTAGYYCDGLGLAHPTGLCDPGYYCIGSAFTSAPPGLPTGGLCPKGGYCPPGSSYPTACAEGTFNNFTGGSTQADCVACTPGYYCSGSNLPYPTGPCSAGYYCTGGASLPTQFRTPAGHYSLAGAPAPEECPLGTFNPSPAQGSCTACIAGFYCPTRAMVTYLSCPPGSYCPAASVLPRSCPAGTYQPDTRRQNITNCVLCPPSQFCQDENQTSPSGYCLAGFYCKKGCITSTCSQYTSNFVRVENMPANPGIENNFGGQCTYGHYCPNASANPISCQQGTIRDALQGASASECSPCPAHYYCASTGMSTLLSGNAPVLCAEGYYCPGRLAPSSNIGCSDSHCAQHEGEACAPVNLHVGCSGDINSDLMVTNARRCSAGFSCPLGSDYPQICGIMGTKSTCAPYRGMSACQVCPAGYWCDPSNLVSLQAPQSCPPGRYCPEGTTRNQPMCPQGSWSDKVRLMNKTRCQLCPPGRYCPYEGRSTPFEADMPFCYGGYYCSSGARNGRGEVGTLGGLGGPCPVGYYCPNGTVSNTSFACPPGTYKPSLLGSSVTACLACTPGRYCEGQALWETTGPCAPGYYCPTRCSDRYCSNKQCIAGIMPNEPLLNGGVCPKGYYCRINPSDPSLGAVHPVPCDAGSYADVTGLASCKDCPAGYFCGLAQVNPLPCGSGRYCPLKTPASNVPRCPPGTYNHHQFSHNITDCYLCPPGRYCPYWQLNTSWAYCAPGFYCTSGAVDSKGTSGTQGGVGGICPTGHYCTLGTQYNTSFPCPPGTFNPVTGGHNRTACVACTPGFYCQGHGLSAPTGPCAPGYYLPHRLPGCSVQQQPVPRQLRSSDPVRHGTVCLRGHLPQWAPMPTKNSWYDDGWCNCSNHV